MSKGVRAFRRSLSAAGSCKSASAFIDVTADCRHCWPFSMSFRSLVVGPDASASLFDEVDFFAIGCEGMSGSGT